MPYSLDRKYFEVIDYCTFAILLTISASTGIFFALYKKPSTKPSNSDAIENFGSKAMSEYLLGSRKLRVFPVAMSLIGSYISATTILSTPSEIYNYGTQYWLIVLPLCLMCWVICQVYMPVYCALKLGSSYEYLGLRFDLNVRRAGSYLFVLDQIMYLPIIIYAPAMAFNQVSGASLHLIAGIIVIVCVFYTIVGGIKAVVFTDAFQVSVMVIAVIIIIIFGMIYDEGPVEAFRKANEGGRLVMFKFDPSMYVRHTVWSVFIGCFSYWTSFNSCNQTMVQRYMTLPTLREAKQSFIIFTGGMLLFVSACCFAGILIYAHYQHCDPLHFGLITKDDQLFPLYVMTTVGHIWGFPGLFIAGVCGAALSSLSVMLNSTSAVILEDIVKGSFHIYPSQKAANFIVKGSILALGCMSMLLVLVVEQLGSILMVGTSLTAIAAGTTFGAFSLGMLVPRSTSKGTIIGMIIGGAFSLWMSLGAQIEGYLGRLASQKLGVWTDGCDVPGNSSMIFPDFVDESKVFFLHRLSFLWINPITVLVVMVVGTSASFIFGARKTEDIDPQLISPVIHRWLPQKCFDNHGSVLRKYMEDKLRETAIANEDANLKVN